MSVTLEDFSDMVKLVNTLGGTLDCKDGGLVRAAVSKNNFNQNMLK